MKTLFILSAMLFFPFAMTAEKHVSETQGMVYICTGGSSKRYHATSSCRGLDNCQGDIIKVTVEKAKSIGRTPCKICS